MAILYGGSVQRKRAYAHTFFFFVLLVVSAVTLGIAANLVSYYNNNGYPPVHTTAYRERIRVLLVAGVCNTAVSLLLLLLVLFAGTLAVAGALTHLLPLVIGFLIALIGVSSLTALTNGLHCSNVLWSKCEMIKALVIVSWIDVVLFLIAIIITIGWMWSRRERMAPLLD